MWSISPAKVLQRQRERPSAPCVVKVKTISLKKTQREVCLVQRRAEMLRRDALPASRPTQRKAENCQGASCFLQRGYFSALLRLTYLR